MPERVLRLNTFLLRNRGLKALAVIMAILAFYAIRSETGREEDRDSLVEPRRTGHAAHAAARQWTNVPVRAVREPGAAASVRVEPAAVAVSVSGRPGTAEALPPGDIRVFVDCTGLDTSATHRLPVHVHLPRGLDAMAEANPASVRVWWENAGGRTGADREGGP